MEVIRRHFAVCWRILWLQFRDLQKCLEKETAAENYFLYFLQRSQAILIILTQVLLTEKLLTAFFCMAVVGHRLRENDRCRGKEPPFLSVRAFERRFV